MHHYDHMRNECEGFFPGQASFAYFFFLGSSTPSSLSPPLGRGGGSLVLMAGRKSTSGAGFGIGIPSLAVKLDDKLMVDSGGRSAYKFPEFRSG